MTRVTNVGNEKPYKGSVKECKGKKPVGSKGCRWKIILKVSGERKSAGKIIH